MSAHDSAVEREALAYARGLLKPPLRMDPAWPALAAMGGLAAAAVALAFAHADRASAGNPQDTGPGTGRAGRVRQNAGG